MNYWIRRGIPAGEEGDDIMKLGGKNTSRYLSRIEIGDGRGRISGSRKMTILRLTSTTKPSVKDPTLKDIDEPQAAL